MKIRKKICQICVEYRCSIKDKTNIRSCTGFKRYKDEKNKLGVNWEVKYEWNNEKNDLFNY